VLLFEPSPVFNAGSAAVKLHVAKSEAHQKDILEGVFIFVLLVVVAMTRPIH